uniref:BTB domain-containing protein n=1 Tax=Amblyomma aureolatum TaxID=187763 RepID=A0A1E1XE00_9ACAR
MGSQQFCLKWNNHQSNMLAVFEQLLSNEALVDVTLACEGLSLKAHKMVLSACSPFFQALFVENPCKHPIVILKDMRYMDLKAIVEFMYRGEVNVSQDQLTALLKTAETLKVKGLAEVTGENKNGALVSVDGADAKPVGTPRAESPPLSKRKRGRPRRRSPSDSNKSDSEDAPPATRIKGPESPEIIEDGSLSSDRVTAPQAESPSRTSTVAVSSTAVPSGAHLGSSAKATNSLTTSQHTQDSLGDDVGEGDDADFEVEPSNLMEQSMTTENVPVFTDVASSSQALGNESQQSHHTGSTSDNSALVPVQASLPSDISISSQVDIKPSPSSLMPYDDQAISPVVAAPPAASSSGDGASSAMMMFMDTSGVPAIAGPSNYHPDKQQQSTPSHVWPQSASSLLQKKHHLESRPVTAPCPYCFAHLSVKSLSRHKKDMHGSQKKVHKCSVCDAKLTRLDNLRRHMILRHRYQKTH